MNSWPFPRPVAPPPKAPPPRPGAGTRLTSNALGYALSAIAAGASFDHPWRPGLGGLRATLRRGTVRSIGGDGVYEPKIKSGGKLVPMSGEDGITPAYLDLDPGVANAAGESWIALEVEPNAGGELVKTSRVEIVHTNTPISHAIPLGRHPLVLILWKKRRPIRVIPITHFHLRYARIVDPVGARHFFL